MGAAASAFLSVLVHNRVLFCPLGRVCQRELSRVYFHVLLTLNTLPLGAFIKTNTTVWGIFNTQLCLSHFQIQ